MRVYMTLSVIVITMLHQRARARSPSRQIRHILRNNLTHDYVYITTENIK